MASLIVSLSESEQEHLRTRAQACQLALAIDCESEIVGKLAHEFDQAQTMRVDRRDTRDISECECEWSLLLEWIELHWIASS